MLSTFVSRPPLADGAPLWSSVPDAGQKIVTTLIAVAAAVWAYYRFLHRRVRVPNVRIEVSGNVHHNGGANYAAFAVRVVNAGDLVLTIVPEFSPTQPRQMTSVETQDPEPITSTYSRVEVYGVPNNKVAESANSGYALVWDWDPWVYAERLDGQWRDRPVTPLVLGPGQLSDYPFMVPLPWETAAVLVKVEVLVTLTGRSSRPEPWKATRPVVSRVAEALLTTAK